MRKKLLMLLFTILYMSGCSVVMPMENIPHTCSESSVLEYEAQNYAIFSIENGQYCYHLLRDGEVFYYEMTERFPNISMADDGIIEIRVGYGTGVSISRFCNINNKTVSTWYNDVVHHFEKSIVRLEFDGESPSGSKHSLIVADMFTGEVKKTCSFVDISDKPMPIRRVTVIDNGIEVEYLTIDNDNATTYFALGN